MGIHYPITIAPMKTEDTRTPSPELALYVKENIVPRYATFDPAHREDHVLAVISRSLELATYYDVDTDMVFAAAAFHDTGLCVDRETHHLESGRIIREDPFLRSFFSPADLETVAQAAEDHRASSKTPPRSIYGRIIAEADRDIRPLKIIERTIQYGLAHYPELGKEEHYLRTLTHLREKYGEGGYLHLFLPESPNRENLRVLRGIIAEEGEVRRIFDGLFPSLAGKEGKPGPDGTGK